MTSEKQREMLAFIEDFVDKQGYPPTYEEIRVGLAISTKSLVNYHLDALQSAELLTRAPNTPRGIRLTGETGTRRVPMIAEIGTDLLPVLTELDPQDVIELTYDIVPNGDNLYAIKVQNGSLLDALVNEGDILIMQPQTQAQNGELVAARLIGQDETTFRRYYRENGHVRLQPDNPTMEALLVKPDAVQVQGKVVAVIRQVE
jgi:repressor LexA